jgi:hypothetical protein
LEASDVEPVHHRQPWLEQFCVLFGAGRRQVIVVKLGGSEASRVR